MKMTFLEEMMAHAADEHPNECCGLVVRVDKGDRVRLVRARNLSREPKRTFVLDPEAWLEVKDDEEVIGIYHTHTVEPAVPSLADRAMCEATNLPWHIVSYPERGYCRIDPCGFEAPYLERPYVKGVHDCYSLLRDWYRREQGIILPDYDRGPVWQGRNLFIEKFEEAGFVRLIDVEPQVGDAFLMQFGQTNLAHCAVYVGNNEILHHAEGRLSCKDLFAGIWRRHFSHHLRHRAMMEGNHG